MRWSDGVPVTAEDFAYGWKQMREEGATTAFLLEDVESAEALDDLTLEVQLTEPRSYFPYILASARSFPGRSTRARSWARRGGSRRTSSATGRSSSPSTRASMRC